MEWKPIVFKPLILLHRSLQRLLGASTVGVRILVINDKDEVMLVKHTYVDGWHLPGGGVHPGESLRQAAKRELEEETGILATGSLEIINIYYHTIHSVNDYPVLFRLKEFAIKQNVALSAEIKEAQWFSILQLPKDISASTLKRINEYISTKEVCHNNEKW